MITFISLLEIINLVCFPKSEECIPDPNLFLSIATFAVDAATVNPNGIKTPLAFQVLNGLSFSVLNGLTTFFIKDNLVFSNGPKSLPKNPLDCPILCN